VRASSLGGDQKQTAGEHRREPAGWGDAVLALLHCIVMSSRWGPPVKKEESEQDPSSSERNNYNEPSYDEFEVIEEVEWGPRKGEDGYDTDQELAPRPRRKGATENCGCVPPPTGLSCRDDSCVLYACREECRSNCEAGHVCGNKRLTRKEFFDVEVFEAGNKGKGLRLSVDAPVAAVFGDIITEYTGRAIRKAALNRLFRRYKLDRRLYIMALGDDVYLDARKKGGLARYINHSCRPNCKVELWTVKGVVRAAVVAISEIQPGEELTFDYQWERKRDRAPTKCHCGMPECRGTIEMPKSLEEQDLERELHGHWEQEKKGPADETLVNRTVQVYNNGSKEYFLGEVTGYDTEKKLHCILYRQDMNEVWEDLSKEDWMVLNEKVANEHFTIGKKRQNRRPSPTSSLVTSAANVKKPVLAKNYLYVQTPVKEAMWAMHLIERCQRNCNVQIQAEQMSRPPLPPNPDDPEDTEKYAALDKSNDATVWKLTIAGSDVPKAYDILQKNVAFVEKKLSSSEESAKKSVVVHQIAEPTAMTVPSQSDAHEVIFPRIIADSVKRKLQSVRDKCRSVNITFVASDSKSKLFSKLILEGSLLSDIEAAKEHLWGFLLGLCKEADAPMTPSKIPRNLGFLGGALSNQQFQLLRQSASNSNETESAKQDGNNRNLGIAANEDLNSSPFIRSFESTNRCTVWVQSQDDQGRIDSSNRVVNEAQPNAPRKIFFGCKPSDVARLAAAIQGRANELARGVKYFHLGADRVYMKLMMKNGGRLFDYVKQVTGASVTVDPMTGDHLRTDGRVPPAANQMLEENVKGMTDGERAALADEIVRLQVECYRDECIREAPWIFGRDWALSNFANIGNDSGSKASRAQVSIGQLDRRTAGHCGMEMAETVANLELSCAVAGHAAIILYRFVNAKPELSTQIKAREALLACVFLANKTQKETKWKRLETVLQAGYRTFYPGSKFDRNSEEAAVLEERVIAAEKEILDTVQYDIFWKDIEWIKVAATHAGKMRESHAAAVFDFAFSGPVLGAGAELWLKYGVEYVFAVAAGFLKADLEDLIPALSLIPLKVSQAAKLLVEAARYGRASSQERCSHPLLDSGKEKLEKYLPQIEQTCIGIMAKGTSAPLVASAAEHRYRILGRQSRQYHAIRGIPRELIKLSILPVMEGIAAESSCRFCFCESGEQDADLILDGPWRAIAIADHLLRSKLDGLNSLPPLVDISLDSRDRPSEQAKVCPGLLSTQDILTAEGWKGTIQAEDTDDVSERRIGGKCCVPGKVSEASLRKAGLRWWIPPSHGPSQSGSIPEMCAMRSDLSDQLDLLVDLAKSVAVDPTLFPVLTSRAGKLLKPAAERFMPVSIQRWPPSKVANKEIEKSKKGKTEPMQMGYSAAALQEMQMLRQLHGVVPSNQGHPNFIIPVGIAFPKENGGAAKGPAEDSNDTGGDFSPEDPIFSLFRSNEENAKAEKRKKQVSDGAHIVFQPTPFVLQRFLSRKLRGSEEGLISPRILAAWFHDILSALVHCHTNHILLRTILPDQIVVDQSGIAKIGAMYRCTVLAIKDRREPPNPRKAAKAAKKERKGKEEGDDVSGNPYAAPEILLGCPKHSKESDVWAAGCLLANLLLNKPIFVGKDRNSLLTSQYKVVGTPSKENYPEAVKFPNYFKPEKKYKRGVERALDHFLPKANASEYQGAVSLIARMLHLDPAQRCTAAEALGHDFITEYVEKSGSDSFRHQYVSDWVALKRHMLQAGDGDRRARDEKRSRKREAMIKAASKADPGGSGDVDDLYDMDDLLPPMPPKKAKHEPL